MRPHRVVVLDVLTRHPPQMPFASCPHPPRGFTVLDFTRYQNGPHATVMLSDMGARVIKVERPPRGGPGPLARPAGGAYIGAFPDAVLYAP